MRKNLKEARQKVGMTQQEMADAIYVNLNYYQKNLGSKGDGERKWYIQKN